MEERGSTWKGIREMRETDEGIWRWHDEQTWNMGRPVTEGELELKVLARGSAHPPCTPVHGTLSAGVASDTSFLLHGNIKVQFHLFKTSHILEHVHLPRPPTPMTPSETVTEKESGNEFPIYL